MPARAVKQATEVSAGGLVTKDGKILLVKMKNLKGEYVWTFPKGHLEGKESPRQAALREVEEESGYACEIRASLALVRYTFMRDKRLVRKRVRWYWMTPKSGTAKPQAGEIYDLKWLPFDKAGALLRYPADFRLLDKARRISA
ncbi:MAG TPA: NUDIX hydrolase [Elusimicrobiota bacterium]|nr:NUDIX hydrolase [Elusimicrobiota bacterium]